MNIFFLILYIYIKIEKRTPRQLSVDSFIPIQQNEQQQQHQHQEKQTTTTTTTAATSTTKNDVAVLKNNNKQLSDTSSECLEATKIRDDKNDVKVRRHSDSDVNNDVPTTTKRASGDFSEDEEEELNFEEHSDGTSQTTASTTANVIRRLSPDSLRVLESEY